MQNFKTDVLIIGSGLAGLSTALNLPEHINVTILSKESLFDTNTNWAQGGIAAVLAEGDTFESHIQDTLIAGDGLCHSEVVEEVIKQAPQRIRQLIDWGVNFDGHDEQTQKNLLALTREGGHSQRRIVHVEDHTGSAVQQALSSKALSQKNIKIFEKHVALELIINKKVNPLTTDPTTVLGAYVLDQKSNQIVSFLAPVTLLATGGAGKAYLYTSNWSGATGDGISLAFRAGARVANLEFMQFHPTVLFHEKAQNFLISEALRGEGGKLINASGDEFMKRYHTLGALAPRDIVARSIDSEMKKTGAECVYLDMTHLGSEFIKTRFPTIYSRCLEFNIDITQTPIPVVPAAHYLCGGVYANLSGQTDIKNLYAVGETACTGLHGANRLASNSLLECLVMGHNAAILISSTFKNNMGGNTIGRANSNMSADGNGSSGHNDTLPSKVTANSNTLSVPEWIKPAFSDSDELIVIGHIWDEVRTLMWNYVGIVRTQKRLARARQRLELILTEVEQHFSDFQPTRDIIELRNITLIAYLTVLCAEKRKESRGIHFNLDFPHKYETAQAKDSFVWPGEWFNKK